MVVHVGKQSVNILEIEKLKETKAHGELEEVLQTSFPAVYVASLKYMGKDAELEEYMDKCKLYRDDCMEFSLYTHGYLLPML